MRLKARDRPDDLEVRILTRTRSIGPDPTEMRPNILKSLQCGTPEIRHCSLSRVDTVDLPGITQLDRACFRTLRPQASLHTDRYDTVRTDWWQCCNMAVGSMIFDTHLYSTAM
jgi:hypothetical protein